MKSLLLEFGLLGFSVGLVALLFEAGLRLIRGPVC
jgi:hypothetical protein